MKAEMNVTPMIDVLLVLIIIFMVIAPSLSVGLDTQVAQPSKDDRAAPPQDIVITVLGSGKLKLNQLQIDIADLAFQLREILKTNSAGAAFVKGGNEVEFAQVAQAIDIAKGEGWKKIALLPE